MNETTLAVGALVVSVASFVISFLAARATERRARMPVLVFVYTFEKGWKIRNVGNGPALDVVVAQKEVGGDWFEPRRVPPMGRDHELVLEWIGHDNEHGLGATYSDFLGAAEDHRRGRYTVTCGNDLNRVRRGTHLPRWKESRIRAYWPSQGPGPIG
jgi:hypothetical protein